MSEDTPADVPQEKPTSSSDEKITVKKSTYNNMIKGLMVAIAVAAFVGGFFFRKTMVILIQEFQVKN